MTPRNSAIFCIGVLEGRKLTPFKMWVILSGKVLGLGWALSTAASLSQVGRGGRRPRLGASGAAFSTLGSFKEQGWLPLP